VILDLRRGKRCMVLFGVLRGWCSVCTPKSHVPLPHNYDKIRETRQMTIDEQEGVLVTTP
jgi:hypothetical protein